jgi:nucleoside-diphosphate-sugar epimerase
MLIKHISKSQMVIYPNTNSGYGTKSGAVMCDEETPLEPISLYGRTKVQAEKELLATGNAITLRLATIFGVSPRMRIDLLVNYFTWEAVVRHYLIIFEKDFKRNYVHIRDVADAFIHCLENFDKMKGNAYNCGLDEANYSKAELAEIIKSKIPDLSIHYAEIGSDTDKRNYIVSNDKLRKAGFEARRTVQQGVDELIKAYKMIPKEYYSNY